MKKFIIFISILFILEIKSMQKIISMIEVKEFLKELKRQEKINEFLEKTQIDEENKEKINIWAKKINIQKKYLTKKNFLLKTIHQKNK